MIPTLSRFLLSVTAAPPLLTSDKRHTTAKPPRVLPASHTASSQLITKIKFQLIESQLIKKYHKLPKMCFFKEAAF